MAITITETKTNQNDQPKWVIKRTADAVLVVMATKKLLAQWWRQFVESFVARSEHAQVSDSAS